MIPGIEALACGPLAVPKDVMAHVVQVESSRNPYAIGVVGGRLQRQPRNLAEAVSTVAMLEERGFNYSVGLAQVNRINFERFGLDTPESRFDPCRNLATGAKILAECLQAHDGRWGDAFSCYYSGNARTGYEHGYVQKVFASMGQGAASAAASAGGDVIPLADGSPQPIRPVRAATATWDTVFSARISAPDAQRVQALKPDAPLVPEAIENVMVPVVSGSPAAANPGPSARGPRRDSSAEPTVSTEIPRDAMAPEARFIAEVRRSVQLIPTPKPGASTSGVKAESDQMTESSDSQQESKRQVSDAARVF